jgi:hypothetical protein
LLRGSGFTSESFRGLDGELHDGLVLHIARGRQALFFVFVSAVVAACIVVALNSWSWRSAFPLEPWILTGLSVVGVFYLLIGGRLWLSPPFMALSEAGILVRAFGGATFVPWSCVRAVLLDETSRRPRLRLALAPDAPIQRRGRARLEALVSSHAFERVPANLFAVTPAEIATQIKKYLRANPPDSWDERVTFADAD